jgi:GntR family transcriptional regulator, rspAB operon transcriptional repressor
MSDSYIQGMNDIAAEGNGHRISSGVRAEVQPERGCWWIPLERQREEATSAVAQTYLKLREQILSGQLEPGTPLSEYQLAKALSVSRTPVREALARLRSAGLVRSIPQRGMFVSELGPKDVVEILEIRERLECLAVRRVVIQGVPESALARWEERTEQARQYILSGQLPEALAIGSSLHDELIMEAGNERLAEILAQLSEQIWLLGMVGIRAPGRPEEANHEHKVLLELIRSGDADGAESLMREHLRNEGRILLASSLPPGALTLG